LFKQFHLFSHLFHENAGKKLKLMDSLTICISYCTFKYKF